MIPFRIHHFLLGGRHYILLPKLNQGQIGILTKRFAKAGRSVKVRGLITARLKEGTLHVSPDGLCWSAFDPSDSVLPAIPDLLAAPKERVPIQTLKAKYLRPASTGSKTPLRITTRIESSSSWDKLRASGDCGLAPDEHAVVSLLLKGSRARCSLVTDFPVTGSIPRICGRKRYYDSRLEIGEALSSLRVVGSRFPRNSYLARDGLFQLGEFRLPSSDDWRSLFHEVEDWCSSVPT